MNWTIAFAAPIWKALALVLTCLLPVTCAHGRTILDLDEIRQPVLLKDWGDGWVDTSGAKSIEQIAALPNAAFSPTGGGRRYFLAPGEALWIKLGIPAAPDDKRWYLKLTEPGLERVDLYTRGSDGNWTVQRAGDRLPVAAWPLPNVYPVFPVRVSAEEPTYYALRIESSQSFHVPITFENESGLSTSLQQASLIHGLYFGLLTMVAGFALCMAVAMREPGHALFGVWALALTLAVASTLGVGGMHLWPNHAPWNTVAKYVLPIAALVPLLLFTSHAISLRARKPWLAWVFLLLAASVALVAAVVGLMDSRLAVPITLGVCVAIALVCCASTCWAFSLGDRFAAWLLIGFTPLLAALAFILAHAMAWVPASPLVRYALALAAGLALPLIFLALMLRSQEKRNYQTRLSQIDRVDPATGLINELVFMHRLRSTIERSVRQNQHSAVVVMDIANRTEILAEYGRRNSLKVILRLAGRLSSMLRDVDSVARLGESRFGLLMEGPVPPERSKSMASKIYAHCIAPFSGLPMGLILKPKIAVIVVPQDAETAEEAIALLDRMLLEAPPDFRRNIFAPEASSRPPIN